MRINADLDRFHADVSNLRCLPFANHDCVGLELHTELPLEPRILENLEKIFAKEYFPSAQGEDKDAGIRHLVQQMLDLRSGHLAMIVVIEITMNAALVAAVSEVELHA
jgi:hypothetical protein